MAVIPAGLKEIIERTLDVRINGFSPLSGGCINEAGRLSTSSGDLFIKWNDRRRYPGMLATEATGLQLLRDSRTLRVPATLLQTEAGEQQLIVLEMIHASARDLHYWPRLGEGLAALHRKAGATFGLDHDNYIGSLPQRNTPTERWPEFFVEERLRPQLERAGKNGMVTPTGMKQFEAFFDRVPQLFPNEPPALIHGDLWSGNLMVDDSGGPCLIDPAVHYGHREAELAFTRLFGGFGDVFYEVYNEVFPQEPDFASRVDLYNVYPLLVHANLFGPAYMAQALAIVRPFSKN